jgi:hypothetical protein
MTIVSLKFAMGSLGACVGAAISLGLNAKANYVGSISQATYIVLITLIGMGFPFALLLPPAKKVQRNDGRAVAFQKQRSLATEFKVLKGILSQARILALLPVIIYSLWWVSYVWSYNFRYFSVRARALNSFIFYSLGFISAGIMGQLMDNTRWKRQTRAKVGFVVVTLLSGLSWILGLAVQVHYSKTEPSIDWSDDAFGLGCFVYALYGFCYPL